MDAGLLPQGLNNVTLPNPTPTQQDLIGSTPNEVSGSQLFDLPAVEGLGVQQRLVGRMRNSCFFTLAVLLPWGRVHDTTYLES